MAEQQTQLISKIVTDDTQTPVGERGGGGGERSERGGGEFRWGGGMQQGWEMLYLLNFAGFY